MPLVSVIIPAYNAEKTILETIQSIQVQTLSDLEIIVINDGSTDETVALVEAIADPRIRIISYENGGLPTARNRGIRNATGEFLSFIDADDLWTPDKLELQVEALRQNSEAGVAYSWTAFIDEKSQFLYAWEPLFYAGNIYPDLLIRNFISNGSNILVRRSTVERVGEFDPTLKSVEDWEYYLRLAAISPFVLVPHYQILYRRSTQAMTSNVEVMEQANLTVIERAFQVAPPELQHLKSQSLANAYRYLAKQHFFNGMNQKKISDLTHRTSLKKANKKFLKAIQLDPKILFHRETQRLLIKLITVQLLPEKLANSLIQWVQKNLPMVAMQWGVRS